MFLLAKESQNGPMFAMDVQKRNDVIYVNLSTIQTMYGKQFFKIEAHQEKGLTRLRRNSLDFRSD